MYRLSTQLWYFPGAPFVFGIWDAHFDWQANCWALWHKRHSNHRVVFTDNCPVVESYTRSLRTNKSPKSLTKFWSQGFTKHYWLAKIGRRFWKLKLQESLVKKTGAKNQPWSLKLICWKTFQSQFYHSLLSQYQKPTWCDVTFQSFCWNVNSSLNWELRIPAATFKPRICTVFTFCICAKFTICICILFALTFCLLCCGT